MTLTEFLTARYDEIEAEAREAGGGTWRVCEYDRPLEPWEEPDARERHYASPSHIDERGVTDDEGETVVYDEGSPSGPQSQHIARHDPAYVLRDIAAKRRLIDLAFEHGAQVDGEWGDGHEASEIRAGKCSDIGAAAADDLLVILAQPFSDHPDYREEWKP